MDDLSAYLFNQALEQYEQFFNIDGGRVRIAIDFPTGSDFAQAQSRLDAWMQRFRSFHWSVMGTCAGALIDLKNEAWLDDGETPLDKTDQRTLLSLGTHFKLFEIHILPDGSADWQYRAGSFFWGHDLLVRLNNDASFGYISLEG